MSKGPAKTNLTSEKQKRNQRELYVAKKEELLVPVSIIIFTLVVL